MTPIEVRLNFSSVAQAVAFLTAGEAGAPGAATVIPSATVTPEKQEAARASTKPAAKPAAAPAPTPTTETKAETKAEPEAPKPVKYEDSGVGEAIARCQLKSKDATIAMMKKHGAVTPEGKPKGSAMPAANYAAFLKEAEAFLTEETLGD